MAIPVVQRFLRLCSVVALINSGSALIQVYMGHNATGSWDAVYRISSHYQSIVGQRIDSTPNYLQVADPENACNFEHLSPAHDVREENVNRLSFFLLADDTPCPRQTGRWDYADSGVTTKIFNAQRRGYSGIIVYADMAMEGPSPSNRDGWQYKLWLAKSRTKPFPMKIPEKFIDQIGIAVHFVGYDYGMQLKTFAYNASSPTRYRLSFTSVLNYEYQPVSTVDPVNRNFLAPVNGPQTHISFVSDPSSQISERSESNQKMISLVTSLLSVVSFIAGTLFCFVRCRGRQRTAREARKKAVEQAVAAQTLAQAAADEEVAGILALRQQQVRQFIEAFMARNPTARESASIPLKPQELRQLKQVTVSAESADICLPCQQNFIIGEMKTVLPCSHVGHPACLTTWLITCSRNCPVCKRAVLTEPGVKMKKDRRIGTRSPDISASVLQK
ncbi:uncharacterized protein LOC129591032 isoform X2 [Paramacrobiotus metropolitanus]|uniref:uncharacterized protein LOC129591032 isoform X2 n=1 Tax=Paramacrobiotus metropolitanus TaxID=2943436 RepID=UPI002445625C|nr:uncharacterized protein LOC129591032 isoform X2 [Paramacrobiotus metropolitanus]